MALKGVLQSMLENGEMLCRGCPEGDELANQLHIFRKRLDDPLRVAIVGIMKAGKSTFMNALIGSNVVYTGDVETTYTVCWFRYGKKQSLTVCFRDGSEQKVPFEDLPKWSVRSYEKENPRINDVKYLIIEFPADILKKMEFIDTPGLNSVYEKDARNTLDFLAIQGEKETVQEAGMADAVIYAFSRTAGDFDQKILQAFQGEDTETASPINSIGILTKTDGTGIWQIYDEITPVQKAKAVADKIMENRSMRQLLFTVLPVCAKTTEGCVLLNDSDWKALEVLARVDPMDLADYLFDAKSFRESEEEDFRSLGNTEQRASLLDKVGQYGILQITELIRNRVPQNEILKKVSDLCGISAVEDLLIRHFGNRTFLIKSQFILQHLTSLLYRIRNRTQNKELHDICNQLQVQIDKMQSSVQNLKELQALQMYYNGKLQFPSEKEREEFLELTGEYGRSPEIRLGAQPGTPLEELADLAKKKANEWHAREADGWLMPGAYVQAASTLARSCEKMYYHLNALTEE